MMTNSRAPIVLLVAALTLGSGLLASEQAARDLPQDRGAAGTWHALLKLGTTASALHTTAHPDDEHGGVLTRLSRRDGVRVALLTLNRGESGDNAIGSQLFDGLGLIRTEELLVSDAYYGVDRQYFTTVIDYGYSKRLDEALDKWGRENVLRDVVRVIRMERPFVLISRFQGNQRDGHGNHQTAGLLTTEAFKVAGDPKMFPEQIAEGLRPWQPFKVYIGGSREDERWHVRVDSGEYSPWLGDSYGNFARRGLSFQRSQVSGRFSPTTGPSYNYYTRVGSRIESGEKSENNKEDGFFAGIDTSIPALFRTLGRPVPAGFDPLLAEMARAVSDAKTSFRGSEPAAIVPTLAEGLKATREAIAKSAAEPEALFLLRIKEQQFMEAIHLALGVHFEAIAQPTGLAAPFGPGAAFAAAPALDPVVPGQTFEIRTALANRAPVPLAVDGITLEAEEGWRIEPAGKAAGALPPDAVSQQRFEVTVPPEARLSGKPYFSRKGLQESRYTLDDPAQFGNPRRTAPVMAVARYTVSGVPVEVRESVRRREPRLPYGTELRELRVVPALALRVSPATAIIPLDAAKKSVTLTVDVLNNQADGSSGELAARAPQGWTVFPATQPFTFARAGERAAFTFTVTAPDIDAKEYEVAVVASAGGREYAEGYDIIEHRDLETAYLYRPSTVVVRGIDVKTAPGLNVGYVMGVGDQVPAAISQLGYTVTLLDEAALAGADLSKFDTIMTGTRAYAVREDLKTYNRRLLDYVEKGGNLVVLYNTQELVPARYAPFPATLPARSEEVSEEDSPVEILAPDHQAFTWPNRITPADFEGWVEQRGSKFWSEWDPKYTAMISTHDRGQEPQRGGWLTARHGQGHYTYFAYAFHRQLPYGVPGAYRLLANVLALGESPRP